MEVSACCNGDRAAWIGKGGRGWGGGGGRKVKKKSVACYASPGLWGSECNIHARVKHMGDRIVLGPVLGPS